jgi:hypothetical protein
MDLEREGCILAGSPPPSEQDSGAVLRQQLEDPILVGRRLLTAARIRVTDEGERDGVRSHRPTVARNIEKRWLVYFEGSLCWWPS